MCQLQDSVDAVVYRESKKKKKRVVTIDYSRLIRYDICEFSYIYSTTCAAYDKIFCLICINIIFLDVGVEQHSFLQTTTDSTTPLSCWGLHWTNKEVAVLVWPSGPTLAVYDWLSPWCCRFLLLHFIPAVIYLCISRHTALSYSF